jgi:hypothetical protein
VDLLKSRGGEHIQVFGGAAASLSGQTRDLRLRRRIFSP